MDITIDERIDDGVAKPVNTPELLGTIRVIRGSAEDLKAHFCKQIDEFAEELHVWYYGGEEE